MLLLGIVLILVLSLIFPASLMATEAVKNFSTEMLINQDATVTIQERISYETTNQKHGIYRYIPYRYQINGLNYRIGIDNISVTNKELTPHPYEQTRSGGNLTLKIGDPEQTFMGARDYLINYTVSDVLQQYEDRVELYWDVTGEGWQFPLEKTRVVVRSPYANIADVACYSGEFGSDNDLCEMVIVDPQMAVGYYNQPVTYGQNFTIAVSLDKNNHLQLPSATMLLVKKIQDNLWLGLLPIPLLAMVSLWYRRGRDYVFYSDNIFDIDPHRPTKLRPVLSHIRTPMVYQPIHELTPGEAGTILDEKVDNQDIIAEIIQLARLGYIKIETEQTGRFIKRTDYVFAKLPKDPTNLAEYQQYLYDQLFKNRDQVKLSQLKGKFYTTMHKVRQLLYQSSTQKALFTANPQTTVMKYGVLSSLLIVVCLGVAFFLTEGETPWPMIGLGWQFVLVPFFAKFMVQKSALGSNYYMQARGLRETLQRGAWRSKIHERNLFIEEVLPFAIAFGVVDRLAQDMKQLNINPPDYVRGMAVSGAWNTQLNSFSSQAVSNLSYNPSSSKAGGSGFSGGSSGGGFGGGGGGSW